MTKPQAQSISIGVQMEPARAVPNDGAAFRMLVMGDFSGGAQRSQTLSSRPVVQIDRDNLDVILAQMNASLEYELPGNAGKPYGLGFRSLEDFHPDQLYANVPLFASLRTLRQQLLDPATFAQAATVVRGWGHSGAPSDADDEAANAADTVASDTPATFPIDAAQDLLSQAIAATEQDPTPRELPKEICGLVDWNAFVSEIVAPHLVDKLAADLDDLVGVVDAVTTQSMRMLIHWPDFQALESAWRGLDFLVRRLPTGNDLKICLLDASKAEIAADLASEQPLEASAMNRLLGQHSDTSVGGDPWSLLVGHFDFRATVDDALLAGALATLAARVGAPFLSAADPEMFGCRSLVESVDPVDWERSASGDYQSIWQLVRGGQDMSFLGLVAPRFLLRLPYGRDSEPLETFDFEEVDQENEHRRYLWGNPAMACAYLLGAAFDRDGWEMCPDEWRDVDRLPLHVFQGHGEPSLKPCAEVLLSEAAARAILDAGVMPLVSMRGKDTVRLWRFQSAASPARPLSGRWNR